MKSRLDILLVDDDHGDRALFGMAADETDLNIWLQSAADGWQAIEYLEGRNGYADRSLHPLPDLLVLDLDMPLTGCLEFLQWRRASHSFANLPVVLISGFAYEGAIKAALDMGANSAMTKPSEFEGWKALVQQIWELGTRSAANAAVAS